MPDNNLKGSNQLTSHQPTQAFLQNLFLGENLRQRQKEIEVANQLDQQKIIANDLQAKMSQQLIDQSMREAFNADQELQQGLALGTIPYQAENEGSIYDVANSLYLPGKEPAGYQQPMKDIEYGKRTTKNYKGETITATPEQQRNANKAFNRQTELTTKDSIAKSAGTLATQKQAQEYRMLQADYEDQLKRDYLLEVEGPYQLKKIEAQKQADIALEHVRGRYRAQNAYSEDPSMVISEAESVAFGQKSLSQVPMSLRPAVSAYMNQAKLKAPRPDQLKELQSMLGPLEAARLALDKAVYGFKQSNQEQGVLGRFGTTGMSYIPSTNVNVLAKELQPAFTALAVAGGERRGVTERDAERFKQQLPDPFLTDEQNEEKRRDYFIRAGRGIKQIFPSFTKEQIISISPDTAPYLQAAEEAAQVEQMAKTDQATKKQIFLESIKQKLREDPSKLSASGLTLEQAIERASKAYDAKQGVK